MESSNRDVPMRKSDDTPSIHSEAQLAGSIQLEDYQYIPPHQWRFRLHLVPGHPMSYMLLLWLKRFLDVLLWLAMELSWTRGHKVSPSKFLMGGLESLGICIDEKLQHSVNGGVITFMISENLDPSTLPLFIEPFIYRMKIPGDSNMEKPPKHNKSLQIWFQVLPRDWRFLTGLPNDSIELTSSHQITAFTVMTTN